MPEAPEEAREKASIGEGPSGAGTVDRQRHVGDEVGFRDLVAYSLMTSSSRVAL